MESENQPCIIDSHSLGSLINDLSIKEDCTNDIISLIRTSSHNHLKKLQNLFTSLNNFDISLIIEETHSSLRTVRQISSYVLLSKGKHLLSTKKEVSIIDDIYNSVLKVRLRDVDPHIRSLTVGFLSEWALASSNYQKKSILKEIGSALRDKSDIVRRKALKSIRKLYNRRMIKKYKTIDFFDSFVSDIVALYEADTNSHVRKEAALLCYAMYLFSTSVSENDIIRIASTDSFISAEKRKALEALIPDGLCNLERLHEVIDVIRSFIPKDEADEINKIENIFGNVGADREAVTRFCDDVLGFLKTSSSNCCQKTYTCYLEVLLSVSSCLRPSDLTTLIEVTKENPHNLEILIKGARKVSCYEEFYEDTLKLLSAMKDGSIGNVRCMSEFIKHLADIKDGFFSNVVSEILLSLQPEYNYLIIRSFDISDAITEDSSSLEKCYAALWHISGSRFDKIPTLKLKDADKLLELSLFLELFCDHAHKILGNAWNISAVTAEEKCDVFDAGSALIYMAKEVYRILLSNFSFSDAVSALYLFKLVDIGFFPDKAWILFEYLDILTLEQLIPSTKAIKAIVTGYFEVVKRRKELYVLAKSIALKIPRAYDLDRYVFVNVKRLIAQRDISESVLPYFVPLLTLEECIVIEGSLPKGKLKTACSRKIRIFGKKENKSF